MSNSPIVKPNYVQGVLQQTGFSEEDVREFCKSNELNYIMLWSHHRRITAMNPDISLSDTLYTIFQAKQNGLPPFGEWYTPVARRGGKGFSLCFRYDAALYVLTHHRDVEGSVTITYVDGKGQSHSQDYSPSFRSANDIDWGLRCVVTAKVRGESVNFSCPYRQWVQYGQDGNVTAIWLHKAGHMLMKQTVKEFVRLYLGASLIFEDHYGPEQEPEQTMEPSDDLPVITQEQPAALPVGVSETFEAPKPLDEPESAPLKRRTRKTKEPVIERAQKIETAAAPREPEPEYQDAEYTDAAPMKSDDDYFASSPI